MKQKPLLIWGILSMAMVFAIVFTGCGNPADGGGINFAALTAKITDAEKKKSGVMVATTADEVAQGMKWVTPQVMTAFETAIDTARDAALTAAAQTEVNNAVRALETAIITFTNAQQDGTKTNGFNQEELEALIAWANAAKTGVKISVNGNDVESTEYWVRESDFAALNTAIAEAEQAATEDKDIDSAYFDLVAAIDTFKSAKQPGSTSLTVGVWADGNITSSNGEQWFSFTATAAEQYIHASFGTLDDLYVQVYDGARNTVGNAERLNSFTTYISRTVTTEQEYYIKIRPYSGSGAYKIAFNRSTTSPSEGLTENKWTDGNITLSDGEQWFSFTATAAEQYIHVSFGTLSNLYVQVYDSENNTIESAAGLNSFTTYISRTVTTEQEYYIKVWPYSGRGTYKIVFNTSVIPPTDGLTENTWINGNITSSNGEQWFSFTAAAAEQYIHAIFGTLDDLYVQMYDSERNTVGNAARLNSSTTYTFRTLTIEQEYYIKVWPYSGSGTYKIVFNTSTTEPAEGLTENKWTDGNITSSGGEQRFVFTVTAATQYIHASFGTLSDLYVQVYDSENNTIESAERLNSSTRCTSRNLTIGQVYYIRVWPYSGSGTYKIAFNRSIIPPGAEVLTANTWTNGAITSSSGEQWFSFTATAAEQYIHASFGTLKDLNVQVYNSVGDTVGSRTNLYSSSSQKYTSLTLTIGQVYYIRVWPYSGSGTYKIAFNTSIILPGAEILTANTWTDGTSSGEQWFIFTATAATQYIHVSFGTLLDLDIQVYDSAGDKVGSSTSLYGSTTSISRTLTIGQEYYIHIKIFSSGTYKITFNWSIIPPGAEVLTANTWTNGNITSSNGEQWFSFTATAATQYIHVSFGTLDDLYVQVYDSANKMVGSQTSLYDNRTSISRTLMIGKEYYIHVWPFDDSGTYKIAFNTSTTAPAH